MENLHSINVPINLTTEILLFGSPKVVPNQDVELFLAVQKFIIRGKRFTRRQCSYGINVGLKRNTAFVIWNGEFAQGDYQYNNKIVLKIYLILENTSRLKHCRLA
jgi:hypothetical protein